MPSIYVCCIPCTNEAVTTIVGRSELFAACFFLSAWLLFRRGHTVVPAALFFLALLSKENAIVLLAVLFLDRLVDKVRSRSQRVRTRSWSADTALR